MINKKKMRSQARVFEGLQGRKLEGIKIKRKQERMIEFGR